jgi:hypothetical protein
VSRIVGPVAVAPRRDGKRRECLEDLLRIDLAEVAFDPAIAVDQPFTSAWSIVT